MAFDIKKTVSDIVDKIKNDKSLGADFQKDPVKTIEKLIGIDLPDEQVRQVVELVKAKLGGDILGGKLGGAAEKLGGLLGKK